MIRRISSASLVITVLLFVVSGRAEPPKGPKPPAAPWTGSVPLEVTGIPGSAEFLIVSTPIDFDALLKTINVVGIVDEHTIRLYRIDSNGNETEEPVQFTPAMQPRLKNAKLLPGTSPAVSYRGEVAAWDGSSGARVSGELSWNIKDKADGARKYRLQFSIPRNGKMVQVPFNPANFRAFDFEGRATPLSQFPTMQLHPQWPVEGVVNLTAGGKLLTSYHIGPTTMPAIGAGVRRPFFYPVIGPDGIELTEFGKPHDPTGSHRHHYSLWIAHNKVGGKDFWSEQGGAIVHEQLSEQEDGPVFCRIVQKTKWIFDKTDLMHEVRTLKAYDTPEGFRLIDVELEFTPAGKEPLELGKTTFGFLAARVTQSMTVFDGGGEILTSVGNRNEAAAHMSHGDWIDQSGPIAPGKWGGISLFDHPTNPHHPTGFHCRNDGWACASFNMDGAYELKPGEPLHLKYRVLLHRGDARTGEVQRRYEEYAAQPVVKIGQVRGK